MIRSLLATLFAVTTLAAERPNFLVIFTDDQTYREICPKVVDEDS